MAVCWLTLYISLLRLPVEITDSVDLMLGEIFTSHRQTGHILYNRFGSFQPKAIPILNHI